MLKKIGEHMCFDETKLKVNHKFVVSGQEKVEEAKIKYLTNNLYNTIRHPAVYRALKGVPVYSTSFD